MFVKNRLKSDCKWDKACWVPWVVEGVSGGEKTGVGVKRDGRARMLYRVKDCRELFSVFIS